METKADVGLSLVNRTGHRLFITLIGVTSLTDGSGSTWNTGDSKGLGGPDNPVPLEPDRETQELISFYQNGQASRRLTFSLRGEIGIMKMDSHGEAVPGQIAIKRGINLSGFVSSNSHLSLLALRNRTSTPSTDCLSAR
jgi:hypothetical protein